jgi:hypothetical protein
MIHEDESGAWILIDKIWYIINEFGDIAEAITIH